MSERDDALRAIWTVLQRPFTPGDRFVTISVTRTELKAAREGLDALRSDRAVVDPDDQKVIETLARVIENRHSTLHGIGDTLREALAEIKRGESVVTPREVTARADVARVEHLQQQMGDPTSDAIVVGHARDFWQGQAQSLEAVAAHYFAGLEHIAKTWAEGNGAGPAAKRVLETAPAADEQRAPDV